jgi:hypothetical protein
LGIILGFCFSGRDSAEAAHEGCWLYQATFGGDEFDVGSGVQRAAAKRGITADALVLVETDSGLGQNAVVRIANATE